MLTPGDRVRLPEGVDLEGGGLVDPVRDTAFALTGTGALVVRHADGRSIREIARAVAETYGEPEGRVLRDVLRFCTELNDRLLLDARPAVGGIPSRLAAVARLAPVGLLPSAPRRRRPLGGSTPLGSAASVGGALLLPALRGGAASGGATLVVLAAAGFVAPGAALAVGAAVGVGMIVHEMGHAAFLAHAPSCLALGGLRVEILHRPVQGPRRRLLAAAGPAAGTLAGGIAVAMAWALSAETVALAAVTLAAQALGLTVMAADGRTACGLS